MLLHKINNLASRKLSTTQKRKLRGVRGALSRWSGQTLADLAKIYHTDKCDWHWYIDHYERHFGPFRRKRLNLLEVGIGGYEDPEAGGASLRMWKAWFPRAHTHGIDIHDKKAHEERRIHTYQGSQIDEGFLKSIQNQIGDIDLIIDDGSHMNDHVVKTFEMLFPVLAPGGCYVIEDTQTSYWRDYGGTPDDLDAPHTSMNRFKRLADSLNYPEWKHNKTPDVFEAYVKAVHFYHNIIFIEKGFKNSPSGINQ